MLLLLCWFVFVDVGVDSYLHFLIGTFFSVSTGGVGGPPQETADRN